MYHKSAEQMRTCQESIAVVETVNAIAIAIEQVDAIKVVVASRDHVQRFVPHKQEPRAHLPAEETDRERHHVKRRGEMVGWADVEDAVVQEDHVGSLE